MTSPSRLLLDTHVILWWLADLVAQARALGLTLVTRDERIQQCDVAIFAA